MDTCEGQGMPHEASVPLLGGPFSWCVRAQERAGRSPSLLGRRLGGLTS